MLTRLANVEITAGSSGGAVAVMPLRSVKIDSFRPYFKQRTLRTDRDTDNLNPHLSL